MKGLGFDSALRAIKRGGFWKRDAWKPNKAVRLYQPPDDDTAETRSLNYLELVYVDGRRAPWAPTRCDLVEEDWREFEDPDLLKSMYEVKP